MDGEDPGKVDVSETVKQLDQEKTALKKIEGGMGASPHSGKVRR